MEVDGFHRQHLAVATSGRTSFDAEDRPHTGFTNGTRCILPNAGECLSQTNRRDCFPFTERRGIHAGNQNEGPTGLVES